MNAALDLIETIDDTLCDLNAVELADALATLTQIITAAKTAARTAEELLVALGENVDHPRWGRFDITTVETRKQWRHNQLARVVADAALRTRRYDGATGELEPEHEAVHRLLMTCAGIGYWKLGQLRALGIDPDEFSMLERTSKVTVPDTAKEPV